MWYSHCLLYNFQWLPMALWIQVNWWCPRLCIIQLLRFTDTPLTLSKLSLGWTASSWNFNRFSSSSRVKLLPLNVFRYANPSLYFIDPSRLYCCPHCHPNIHWRCLFGSRILGFVPIHVSRDPSVTTPHYIRLFQWMCKFPWEHSLPCSFPFLSAWHVVDIQEYVELTPGALGDEVFLF